MEKVFKNNWHQKPGEPFACAQILRHEVHPEGLDIDRIRFLEAGRLTTRPDVGHLISIVGGNATLYSTSLNGNRLQLEAGVHMYLPPGFDAAFEAQPQTDIMRVSSPTASQARGNKFLLRDEVFVAACASGSQALRWVLTPQYLSRRIFLEHDPILLSKAGHPVSWFRTTMFDVAGLPHNEEGQPVFKMSYNSRTEVDVCYDVKGAARVRMAQHPYRESNQLWDPWFTLDDDSTYHLNEAAGSREEECLIDEKSQARKFFRNKHEVHIIDGHVSLCCMFDPSPTGFERHQPGEYSDYPILSQDERTEAYETYRREIAKYDDMVDRLSFAKAMGELNKYHGTPTWQMYLQGREAQAAIETELMETLAAQRNGREHVVAHWIRKENND